MDVGEAEWRTAIETDVRKLDAAMSRLFTKQEATDDKIDAQNAILSEIRRDIGGLKQGPELWRYGTLAFGILGACWFLVETYTGSAVKDALMADRMLYMEVIDPRLDELSTRLTKNEDLSNSNQVYTASIWEFMQGRDERREQREKERIASINERNTQRHVKNEEVIERLRAAREKDLENGAETATIDKDEMERELDRKLWDAVKRLETAVGHLRAAFPHNLPGGDQ